MNSTATKREAEIAAIADGIRVHAEPDSVFEICIFGKWGGKQKPDYIGYYSQASIDKAANDIWMHDQNADRVSGVYIGINPPHDDMLAKCANRIEKRDNRATEANIKCRRRIAIDIDPERMSGISSTDEEKKYAWDVGVDVDNFLSEHNWPVPTIVDSGNGYQFIYSIDEPNDKPTTALIERFIKGLSAKFSDAGKAKVDVSGFDAPRLMCVAGTMKRKGDDCPDLGRPHRRSKIVSKPELIERVTREQIEAAIAALPQPPEPPAKDKPKERAAPAITSQWRVDDYPQAERIERLRAYTKNSEPCIEGNNGSGGFIALCCTAFRFGIDESCVDVFEELNQTFCQPPFSEKEVLHKIEDAREFVGAEFGSLLLERAPRSESKTSAINTTKQAPVFKPQSSNYPSIANSEGQTELANAQRFEYRYRGKVFWVDPWRRWVFFDGQRWADNATLTIESWAQEIVTGLWQELGAVANQLDAQAIKNVVAFIRKSNTAYSIKAMLELVKALPGVAVSPNVFNSNPWLFNVQNGTIDLRTGKIRAHDPADRITQISPVVFDASAQCPQWESCVDAIFCRDKAMVRYVRGLLGYSMTGEVGEQILPILHGYGANGKGTLLNTVLEMFGDYGMTATNDLLVTNDSNQTNGLADLFGKRLVVSSEPDEGARLNESLVKMLTGGDAIRARRLYENLWEFQPTHKVMLVTNHKPIVRGNDHGIWRRLKLVPFKHTFEGAGNVKNFKDRLRPEWSGILNWLLAGLADWRANGLVEPAAITKASDDYKSDQDKLSSWIADCCIEPSDGKLKKQFRAKGSQLYASYLAWHGPGAMNNTVFGLKMSEKYEKKTSNGVWYVGIGLKNPPKEPDSKSAKDSEFQSTELEGLE